MRKHLARNRNGIEEGTHAELLAADGLYSEMWRRQSEAVAKAEADANRSADTHLLPFPLPPLLLLLWLLFLLLLPPLADLPE